MKITTIKENDIAIAIISSSEVLISDVQSALDLIVTINYETDCNCIILNKSILCEEFFDLKTRLAGEILQKFINYHMRVAILGDFTMYSSKSLKDFIYESNRGKDLFFVSNETEAMNKLVFSTSLNH